MTIEIEDNVENLVDDIVIVVKTRATLYPEVLIKIKDIVALIRKQA